MNLDELKREMQADGSLRSAAASPEAKRLLGKLDTKQVERAAQQGDTAALKRLMDQVLGSPEGRALAERIRSTVQKKK